MKQWMRKIVILFIALILSMVGFGIVGYSANSASYDEIKTGNFVAEGQIPYVEARKSAMASAQLYDGDVKISGWDNDCDTPVIVTYTNKNIESINKAFYINIYMTKDQTALTGENVKLYHDNGSEVIKMKKTSDRIYQFTIGSNKDPWTSTKTVKFTVEDGDKKKQGEIRFVLKDYPVNVIAPEAGGTISADKTEAPEGEEIILMAEPEKGWKLKGWKVTETTEGGGEVSVTTEGNTAMFNMPKGGVNATAEFEKRKEPDFVVEGQIPKIEARKQLMNGELAAGKIEVSGWDNNCDIPFIVTYTDRTAEGPENNYIYINIRIKEDTTLFVKEGVKFFRVNENEESELPFTNKKKKDCYQLEIKFDGDWNLKTVPFVVKDGDGNEKSGEVRFAFKGPSYAISTVNPSAGGTVSADKTEASEGEEVTLTAEPETGWKLKNWNITAESGEEVTATAKGDTAKFTMPGEPVNITAEFEKLSNQAVLTGVQLLDSAGSIVANGTTSGEKSFEVQLSKDTEPDMVQYLYMKLTYSENATVKMLPNGYDDATGSNGTWASGNIMCNMEADRPTEFQVTAEDGTTETYTLTIKSVQQAQEPEKRYSIAISTPDGGSLTVAKTEVAEGEKIKVFAVPDAGYEMEAGSLRYSESVNGGAVVVINETSMEFTMPPVGITVTCNWKKTSGQTPEPGGNKPSIKTCLVGGVNCAVNNTEQMITVIMPYSTDLKALKIEYTANDVQSASLASGQTADFSSPVPLTLKGTDGSIAVYTVWVTVQEATPAEKLWGNLSDTNAHTPWWKQAEGQKNRGNYPNSWGE